MQDFTQLGIAGATLLILLIVVRFFIQAITKKDEYIKDITEKFSETINTHLTNENSAREKEMAALTQVIGVLDQHTQVLSNLAQSTMSIVGGMDRLNKNAAKIRYGRRKSDKPLIHT